MNFCKQCLNTAGELEEEEMHTDEACSERQMEKKQQILKLTYFDIPGRAEKIRMIFDIAQIPYEDVRIPFNEWPEKKPTFPFHHLPVLEVDGKIISESLAIYRYAANRGNFLPKNPLQIAIGDAVIYYIEDLFTQSLSWLLAPEAEKEAAANTVWKQTLVPGLKHLDAYIQRSVQIGFIAGGKLSAADISLFQFVETFADFPHDVKEHITMYCSNIATVLKGVKNAPVMQRYLEKH